MMMTHHFNRGYYHALDEVMNWINACDSGEMTVKEFRSLLWLRLLDMRPNDASRRTTDEA